MSSSILLLWMSWCSWLGDLWITRTTLPLQIHQLWDIWYWISKCGGLLENYKSTTLTNYLILSSTVNIKRKTLKSSTRFPSSSVLFWCSSLKSFTWNPSQSLLFISRFSLNMIGMLMWLESFAPTWWWPCPSLTIFLKWRWCISQQTT